MAHFKFDVLVIIIAADVFNTDSIIEDNLSE